MARLARFVIPGQPQHVIVRGHNRSEILCGFGLHFLSVEVAPGLRKTSMRSTCLCIDEQSYSSVDHPSQRRWPIESHANVGSVLRAILFLQRIVKLTALH
jgi:hypothetical protein